MDRKPDRTDVVPIPRLINLDDYLDYVTNRVLPDQAVRTALEKLWSASAFMGADTTTRSLETTTAAASCRTPAPEMPTGTPTPHMPTGTPAPEVECAACGIDLPQAVKELDERAFMIVVQDFQDPYTLNVKQLMKCCVEEITPDGRIIPFCAYNSVGYREQVRAQMSGVAIADVVPNATELQPLLTDSPYGSKIASNGDGGKTGNVAGDGAGKGPGDRTGSRVGDRAGKEAGTEAGSWARTGRRPANAPDTTNVGRPAIRARVLPEEPEQ